MNVQAICGAINSMNVGCEEVHPQSQCKGTPKVGHNWIKMSPFLPMATFPANSQISLRPVAVNFRLAFTASEISLAEATHLSQSRRNQAC